MKNEGMEVDPQVAACIAAHPDHEVAVLMARLAWTESWLKCWRERAELASAVADGYAVQAELAQPGDAATLAFVRWEVKAPPRQCSCEVGVVTNPSLGLCGKCADERYDAAAG